jgi:hypothetical protein
MKAVDKKIINARANPERQHNRPADEVELIIGIPPYVLEKKTTCIPQDSQDHTRHTWQIPELAVYKRLDTQGTSQMSIHVALVDR